MKIVSLGSETETVGISNARTKIDQRVSRSIKWCFWNNVSMDLFEAVDQYKVTLKMFIKDNIECNEIP